MRAWPWDERIEDERNKKRAREEMTERTYRRKDRIWDKRTGQGRRR